MRQAAYFAGWIAFVVALAWVAIIVAKAPP